MPKIPQRKPKLRSDPRRRPAEYRNEPDNEMRLYIALRNLLIKLGLKTEEYDLRGTEPSIDELIDYAGKWYVGIGWNPVQGAYWRPPYTDDDIPF